LRNVYRLFLFVSLFGVSSGLLQATSFVVPSDLDMTRRAIGIVRATVVDSYSRLSPGGTIETVTRLDVFEVVKGRNVFEGPLEIVHLGGVLDDVALVIHGSPSFVNDEEVLVFLTRRKNGEWTTQDLMLGKFGRRGALLLRDEKEVTARDGEGRPHREKKRDAEKFLDFVRETVRGGDAKIDYMATEEEQVESSSSKLRLTSNAAGDYASRITFNGVTHGYRWNGFPGQITFVKGNSHPSYANGGDDAINAGVNAWTNDCASNVLYAFGGLDATANVTRGTNDGKHSIVFEDPHNEITGSWTGSGTLAIGGDLISSATHSLSGETFYTAVEAFVVIQDGVSAANGISASSFTEVMVHELGHTLGFRHSNDSGRSPTTNSAIMNSTLNGSFVATLQQYDKDAVGSMYPSACVAITPPSGVIATAQTATSVSVAWNAVAGASSYRVYRSSNGLNFAQVGSTSSTSFPDSVSAATAHLYKVRAVDGSSNESGDSNIDLATSVIFTDALNAGATGVRALHLSEIGTAVSAVKVLAGQGAFTFTQSPLAGSAIRSSQITEPRAALNTARMALGLAAISFTDPAITIGSTLIRASHVVELRSGTQ
jgi:hypothetical protein